MNHRGLTDSVASLRVRTGECPRCHCRTRVGQGLCLSCLLQVGTATEDDVGTAEFEAALAAVGAPDSHWRLGNYEIFEEIGRGGMGIIYRARQRHSRRIVALKRILSYHAESPESRERFRREAQAAASLDHPNILPIYEVSQGEDGVPHFSMKYAAGGNLRQAGPALRDDPREIIRLVAKVTRAVQYAHRAGILHRDLKPGNILLDGRGEPMVTDFGLAKWLDASTDLTTSLAVYGTPGFVAPEQAQGETNKLTPAADVYSLGAIIFTLLAGRPPFVGENALAVMRQAAEKPAPKLRSLVKGADKDLETICARCLERDPSARYQSAGELAEDLERWLEGRSILARPVSPPVRVWRWTRRNPFLAGAAIVALLLGAAVVAAQIQKARLNATLNANAADRRSVVVLPFINLDKAEPEPSFARRFSSSLGPELARFGASRVAAAAPNPFENFGVIAPRDLAEFARREHARAVLSGTVRQRDGKWRVSLTLKDAASGETILQKLFLLPASAVPEEQIATDAGKLIFTALDNRGEAKPADSDPALRNPVASEFLRAGHEFEVRRGKSDLDHALACFEQAVEAAPTSALARARFAMTAVSRNFYAEASPDMMKKARAWSAQAIQENPALPEAHRAMAGVLYAEGDLAGNREQSLEAIELGGLEEGPVIAVAGVETILGRPDRAVRWRKVGRSLQERPSDYEFAIGDGWALLCLDREAEKSYRRMVALRPDLPEGWAGLCRLKLLEGDLSGARAIYQQNLAGFADYPYAQEMAAEVEFFSKNWSAAEGLYLKLSEKDPDGGEEFYGGVTYQSALGRLQQLFKVGGNGNRFLQKALVAAEEDFKRTPANPNYLYRLAAVEASLGQIDSALTHLQSAFAQGWLDYRSLALDPRFDSLRDDPRFATVTKAMAQRVKSLQPAALATLQNDPSKTP